MDQPLLSADALLAALHWRYATKKFDPAKKLSDEQWAKLEQSLLLAPSSYGMQPYKFIVITDAALREQLKPAAFGQSQITDCSHLVVFAARTDVTDQDVDHCIDICPMEGFDNGKFDEILGLPAKGYRAVVLAAVGHRAEDDGAASLPKVRFPAEELIERR